MFRALIVEDDKAHQKIYEYILKAAGFQVSSAYNGKQAIQHLDIDEFPHLIILDAKMPGSNGLDVLQYLETCPNLDTVNIVVATAGVSHETEYMQYAEKFPAVYYLLKPDLLPALQDILKQYVAKDCNGHG